MESCSKELTLAIKLTKIISVTITQGKENVSSNPTREFFDEVKEHLGSQAPAQILLKTLYFLHRVVQKSYTQLLVTEQEYAIWLSLHILEKNTWCKPLVFKSAQLALKVLANLSLYLQQQELITEEERLSWQRLEKLLSLLLLFLHKSTPYLRLDCPSFLEASFPACFISAVPEDFTLSSQESSLCPRPFSLFDESYDSPRIFMNYTLQVLRQIRHPTPLVLTLVSLLSSCPKLPEVDLFLEVVEAFASWAATCTDYVAWGSLALSLGRINTGGHPQAQRQVLHLLSGLLEANERHLKEHGAELLQEGTVVDLCSVLVESLQSGQEACKQPQNVRIAGFGKERYEEEEASAEEYCSFNRTGSNYEMQHWYFCYTCKLVANRGTCGVCARRCHKGHEIVYSRRGNFFCDCGGSQGANSCKSMPKGMKRKLICQNRIMMKQEMDYDDMPSMELRELLAQNQYYGGEERSRITGLAMPNLLFSPPLGQNMPNFMDYPQEIPDISESSQSIDIPSEADSEEKKEFNELEYENDDSEDDSMGEMEIEESGSDLGPSSWSSVELQKPKEKPSVVHKKPILEGSLYFGLLELVNRTLLRYSDIRDPYPTFFSRKTIETSHSLSRHLCTFKAFSGLKSSYSEHKELKEFSSKYPGSRNSLAFCSDLNLILMAEGNKLLSVDTSLFSTTSTEAERLNMQYLCKHVFSFQILSIVLNPNNRKLAAVVGLRQISCILLCSVQNRGYIEKKLTLNVTGSEAKDLIVKVRWMPRSQSVLAVCTAEGLRVYDLSKDLGAPLQSFKCLENDLTDMVVENDVFLMSTAKGIVYRQKLCVGEEILCLKEVINLPGACVGVRQRITSMEWIDTQRLLIVNIAGKIIILKPDMEFSYFLYDLVLDMNTDSNLSPYSCGISNIIPVPTEDSLVWVGISRKVSSSPMVLKISEQKAVVHSLKKSTGYVDGICMYAQGNNHLVLIQNDDASLALYSVLVEEDIAVGNLDLEAMNNWLQVGYLPKSVSMSVCFFEKCMVLNGMRMWGVPGINKNEVVVAGDPVAVFGSSKQALEKLSVDKGSECTGIISSMLADPRCVTITVSLEGNSATSLLLAGFKIYMETGSGAFIEILNRKIPALAQKKWYDIGLCEIEVLKGYLHKQITLKIHTPNPARHPIRLFHLEIFAVTQSDYCLEQKLGELSKVQSGSASPTSLPCFYKQESWQRRCTILDNYALKPLVVYLNAMACTSIVPSPQLYEIFARLSVQVFASRPSLLIVALRLSLKGLFAALGQEEAYAGTKALVMCWALLNYQLHNEDSAKATLKALCSLLQNSPSMFAYTVKCYPGILRALDSSLSPTAKYNAMEKYLDLLFAVAEFRISNEGMEIFLELLTGYSLHFKEQVIAKTYALVRKISMGTHNRFCASDVGAVSGDVLSQIHAIFSLKDMKETRVQSPDLLYILIEWLCRDWSGGLSRVNGILSLLHKTIMHIEKVWVKKEVTDPRLFSIITEAITRELQVVSCKPNSQGRLYFLMFSNLITSYYRPKEEKYSKVRKLHKSVVSAFVNTFPQDVLESVYWKLREVYHLFGNKEASLVSMYSNEFLVEVVEANVQPRLREPEDPLLMNEWDGVMGPEIFEQENDQFLVSGLVDFAYNLITVAESEKDSMEIDMRFFISENWKVLLIDMILEPSLAFAHSSLEKLLEKICKNHELYVLALYQAKINKHFSTIFQSSERNNCFKNFSYIESIFLLKELIGVKESIKSSGQVWDEISMYYIKNPKFIKMLLNISLNLTDQSSEECLSIVNLILNTNYPSSESQFEECITFLWDNYLELAVPVLISKLTLSGNAVLSKNTAELLSCLSAKASKSVCAKLEDIMLHYLEVLPNLGGNSYHFIMNFMAIAGNSLHSEDLNMKFCKGVIRGLENSCKQLSNNIDYQVYEELEKIFSKYGFHWYLLEREPCLKCFGINYTNPEQAKLSDIQSETRFSDCCYFVRFKTPIKISNISIKLSEIRGHKAVTGASIYFCNDSNKDLADLKNHWQAWSILKTIKIKPASTNSLEIDLPIPTIMLNLLVKFHTVTVIRLIQEDLPQLYSSQYLSGRSRYNLVGSKKSEGKGDVVGISMGCDRETTNCPRCSKAVEDKYGICSCGENAYQCLKCRNINYENLDAFLCNECGEGRYCKIDIYLKYTLDAICESITSEKDMQALSREVDTHLGAIQGYYENLPKSRETLNSYIFKYRGEASSKELKENSSKELSPVIYCLINTVKEYQESYYSMMISVKSVALLRTAIMNYQNLSAISVTSEDSLTRCYGCNFSFVSNLLKGLKSLKNFEFLQILIEEGDIIEMIVQYIVHGYSQKLKKKGRKLIVELSLFNSVACERLYQIINSHLTTAIQYDSFLEDSILEEIQLVLDFTSQYFALEIDLVDKDDVSVWELVLREFWHIFFIVLEKSWEDSKLSKILAQFLDIILEMIFKTLVLKPAKILPEDPVLAEFFRENPALMRCEESSSNSHDLFLASISSSGLGDLYNSWQEGLCTFDSWSPLRESNTISLPHNWLMDCLLYSTSARVQDMSRMIILCLAGSGTWKECLGLMLDLLPEALAICHQGADYYFTVLSRLLESPLENLSETLEILLRETDISVQSILLQQDKARARGTFLVNISLGHGLVCLLHMLSNISETWGKHLLREKKFANYIINSFLNARKIQFVKNKVIAESQEFLEKLFDQLHLDCSEGQRYTFLQECITALLQRQDDQVAQCFLVQQISRIVAPVKPECVYYLRLDKAESQEEYIRGNIERNPYSSAEIGPLMSDVRRHICKDLEMSEPEILELLVANQIISPGLRIADVYEYVQWPAIKACNHRYAGKSLNELGSEETPQMVVTFRLAGLDGEATENIVETLPNTAAKEQDPEDKYKITGILGIPQTKGMSVLKYALSLLAEPASQELKDQVLELLYFACQISSNRAILCQLGGVATFFTMLKSSLHSIQQLLKILELLVADPNSQPYIARTSEPIQLIIDLLSSNKDSLIDISPLLPFLCHGNADACRILVSYFLTQINPAEIPAATSSVSHIEKMLEALPASHCTLRDAFLASGVTASLCTSFRKVDPGTQADSTRFLLRILKGLVRAHYQSQQLLDASIIEKIFRLKNEANDVGPSAECLIEAIVQDPAQANPSVADMLQMMILNEESKRREMAAKKRVEILKQFPAPNLNNFGAMLEEEEGLACVICKEGYGLRPDDILGFYVFVSSVSVTKPSSETSHVMSTVTHFNPIHMQCHREAARAEKAMKKPKTEWEGATIRNQHTKCNNWYPICGPQILRHDYAGGVQWMFSSYPAVENRLCNEIHNLKLLIDKFCYEESFSKESKGGGPEHNMQAIPYILQLIYYLMEEEKEYTAFIVNEKKVLCTQINELKSEHVMYLVAIVMITSPYLEWVGLRERVIRGCWIIAKTNPRSEVKIKCKETGTEDNIEQKLIISAFKPFLLGIKIWDLIHSVLFAGVDDINANKVYLQSADPSIQERSLFIHESYKRVSNMQSIQKILAQIDPNVPLNCLT